MDGAAVMIVPRFRASACSEAVRFANVVGTSSGSL
jgi:hypothetical protein